MWRFPEHDPDVLERFRERRAEVELGSVLVHALYLCNLAAPDRAIYSKSVETMRSTMETACAIGADGVVVHVGSHLGSGFQKGLKKAVPALRRVLELCSDTTWLLLENSAGAGGTIGRSIAELSTLVDALDRHPRLGICLDTCHLYVSGVDVTDRAALDATLDEVERDDRPRPASRAARERCGDAARLEPRPTRERARGRARRGARRLPRPSVAAGPARGDGDAGPGQARPGRRRAEEGARPPSALARAQPTRPKLASPHLTSGKAAARATIVARRTLVLFQHKPLLRLRQGEPVERLQRSGYIGELSERTASAAARRVCLRAARRLGPARSRTT